MTPREAEQLLGGYATGTLTEAERRALFAAALEDQALFDALADEEALRELLADAATRTRLLALLAEPARKPAVPLWRRPASLGLAASILAAVGVGLALHHGPAPRSAEVQPPVLSEEQPKAAAPAQKVVEAPRPPRAEKKPSPPKPSPRLDRAPAAPPPPPAIASTAPDASAAPIAENRAAPAPLREKAEAKQAPEPPSAEAGVSAMGALYSSRDAARLIPSPAPTWTLDAAPAGTFRLTVRWGPGGHLYLLRRDASGVSVLAPTASPLQEGKRESRFTGALGTGSVLDLYLLPEASKTPEALPAEGALQGFRARVWPVEKKAP
jgi:hypothetical protein